MSKPHWTLEQLKTELSSYEKIKDWILTEENTQRRERYFMSDAGGRLVIDQDRRVQSSNITIKLFVNLPTPNRHGEITKKLFPSLPLKPQVEAAIAAALQTDHQTWALPRELPQELLEIPTTDPKMAEDLNGVMNEITFQIETALQKKRNTVFNSAELFLSVHDRQLYLSNGLKHRASLSKIYAEAAFSFARMGSDHKVYSDEYLGTHWGVKLDDLPIEGFFDEISERAEHSLTVIKPETGKYQVIVDAEVLSHLLNGHLVQLSASNAYNGLPFVRPGEELIPNSKGDLLTITLDPTIPYGPDSATVSEQGLLQKRLKLVEKNKVIATMTDQQYGSYLGQSPTTSCGNLVLEVGALTHQELTSQSPVVIEILQFSGLFSDPNTGTFSSEIRLAKLYDNKQGKVTYIKGGSLSGSISENFKGIRLSNALTHRASFSSETSRGQGYYGPKHALLSDVSIVG